MGVAPRERVRSTQHEEEPGVTRRIRVSVRAAAALIVVGLAVSACSTTQLGAAAITGSGRITSETLTNQVANLTAAYQANQAKGIKPQRPVDQAAQQVLSWLILFSIYDKVAQQQHIYVTPAEVNRELYGPNSLSSVAGQNKVTLAQYVSAAGAVPPDLITQLGQYLAIQTRLVARLNGGKPPTAASPHLQSQVLHAQCVAAKSLSVQVNPQFGVFDYRTYTVVPAAPKLAADPVPIRSTSKPLVNPPC
jgi:peptidyl-prolyl cis-trans isomerase SurA